MIEVLAQDEWPAPRVGCRVRWTDRATHFGKVVEIHEEHLVVVEEGGCVLRRVLPLSQVVFNLSGGKR